MFSIATSLFNIETMEFDWKPALENFLEFADELVININKSEDNTASLITDWKATQSRQDAVKLVFTEFSYDDPQLDGKCKNNAVQNCTHQFIILLDIDERVLKSQRKQWERLALEYIQKDKTDTILIPSLNLWGSEEKVRDINQKWYIQRLGVRRGVENFARNKDGTFQIEKSDGCEPLIDKEGTVARGIQIVPPQISSYEKIQLINQNHLPYVVHYGYVDLDKRVQRTQKFWKKQWQQASGREMVDVPEDIEKLKNTPTFEHGLKLRDEKIENVEESQKVLENQES